MLSEMRAKYAREGKAHRTREREYRIVNQGTHPDPDESYHQLDLSRIDEEYEGMEERNTSMDDTLAIPIKIANRARRHSACSDASFLSGFSDMFDNSDVFVPSGSNDLHEQNPKKKRTLRRKKKAASKLAFNESALKELDLRKRKRLESESESGSGQGTLGQLGPRCSTPLRYSAKKRKANHSIASSIFDMETVIDAPPSCLADVTTDRPSVKRKRTGSIIDSMKFVRQKYEMTTKPNVFAITPKQRMKKARLDFSDLPSDHVLNASVPSDSLASDFSVPSVPSVPSVEPHLN